MGSRFHFYRISRWRVGALALGACLSFAAASALEAAAQSGPVLSTAQGCYAVGQAVTLAGTGFAPSRTYVVTIDGVYLGNRTTDSSGNFAISVHPGGLPAGTAQHVDQLVASDGSSTASASFTLTRNAGARIYNISGSNPATIKGRFQVWGYSMSGAARTVYVHYVSPSGRARKTVAIGRTSGQCGALHSAKRRVFPLSTSSGTWTVQIDTKRSYSKHPGGPATKIRVRITG